MTVINPQILVRTLILKHRNISATIYPMGKDGARFIAAVVITIILGALVVFSGYRRDMRTAMGERVDMEKIQSLVEEGQLSFKEAEFWEVMEAPNQ
jgi:hypothetical protein